MATTNYIDMVNNLKQEMFNADNSAIFALACSLACITALLTLVTWYNQWQNDPWGKFDMKSLVRIFTMLLLVCNFNTFVLLPMDYLSSIVSKGITASVKEDKGALQYKLSNAYQTVEDALTRNTMRGQFEQMLESGTSSTSLEDGISGDTNSVLESSVESDIDRGEKKGFWGKVWGAVTGAVQYAMSVPYKSISNILSWLISCIVDLVRFVMMLLSGMNMIILGLIGPFVFAISIIPTFKGSVGNWFARYIQFSFWVPICSMIDYINFHIKDELLDVFAKNNLVEQMVFPTFFIILLDVATLFMLFSVPNISAWIVNGDGAKVARSVVSTAQKAATVFLK